MKILAAATRPAEEHTDEISLLRWADDGGSFADLELEHYDFYVEILKNAADALRSRSYSRESLGMLGEIIPPAPIEGKLLEVQRGRGAPFSRVGTRRFFADPNLVAAVIAALCVNDWRGTSDIGPKRQGPYKVRCADGLIYKTHDAAAKYAVKLVSRHYLPLLPEGYRRRARPRPSSDRVKDLLKYGRTNWPSDDPKRPSDD
jgi:hypothetical protein